MNSDNNQTASENIQISNKPETHDQDENNSQICE